MRQQAPQQRIAAPDSLVAITGQRHEPRADSRVIAVRLGIAHHNVMQTVTKYASELRQHGGVVLFKTDKPTASQGGRPERYALLTEDQALFLLTLSRNTPRAVALKSALVSAFRAARDGLEAYRTGALPQTHALHDAIASVPGGPGPYLFSNVNKAINRAALIASDTRAQHGLPKQAFMLLLQTAAAKAIAAAADARDAYCRALAAIQPYAALKRAITPKP